MTVKDIANIAPAMSAVSMVGYNVRKIKKKKGMKAKDMVDLAVTNIVGTSMIRSQSSLISTL